MGRPVYGWGNQGEPRPLAERLLAVPEFRDRYSFYLSEILQQFVADRLVARVDELHDMITDAAEADTFRSLDYGYTVDDFHRSYTEATGGHVEYGIKPFISLRRVTAFIQLELNNIAPVISEVSFSPEFPQVGESIVVNVFIEDEDAAPAVQVFSAVNGASRDPVALFDDGAHNDGMAGDRVFGGTLPAAGSAGTLTFYISAEDGGGQLSTAPRDAPAHTFAIELVSGVPALFINEFMASNDSTIADEAGEFDDWLELYNGDSTVIWLGDKFLTDNLGNLDKWQLPDTTLQPDEFLLVWCDSDPEQGPLHTSFKLSAGSEQIGVVASVAGGFVPIDSLGYGPQQTDVSFGRSEDGGPVWRTFVVPTPGRSNEPLPTAVPVISSVPRTFSLMQNYPNPFNPATTIRYSLDRDGEASLQVYNLLGQLVYTVFEDAFQTRGRYSVVVDLSQISTGIYFYRLESEGRLITRKLTLIK